MRLHFLLSADARNAAGNDCFPLRVDGCGKHRCAQLHDIAFTAQPAFSPTQPQELLGLNAELMAQAPCIVERQLECNRASGIAQRDTAELRELAQLLGRQHKLHGELPHFSEEHVPTCREALELVADQHVRLTTERTTHGAGLSLQQAHDLERYLDVTRAEILFARGVMLVEGPAELYLVPAFADGMGHSFDSLGVTTCAVHGVDFKPYRSLLGPSSLQIPTVVVTDGDADEDARGITEAGVRRGRLLLGPDTGLAAKVETAIDADRDFSAARTLLREDNIFVGDTTLETDLLASAADPMKETFAELKPHLAARKAFDAAIDAAVSGGAEERRKLLAFINRVGKGRFAQRLVPHLDGVEPPDYIRAAIDRIVQLMTPNA